jgi:hypothetical protein
MPRKCPVDKYVDPVATPKWIRVIRIRDQVSKAFRPLDRKVARPPGV